MFMNVPSYVPQSPSSSASASAASHSHSASRSHSRSRSATGSHSDSAAHRRRRIRGRRKTRQRQRSLSELANGERNDNDSATATAIRNNNANNTTIDANANVDEDENIKNITEKGDDETNDRLSWRHRMRRIHSSFYNLNKDSNTNIELHKRGEGADTEIPSNRDSFIVSTNQDPVTEPYVFPEEDKETPRVRNSEKSIDQSEQSLKHLVYEEKDLSDSNDEDDENDDWFLTSTPDDVDLTSKSVTPSHRQLTTEGHHHSNSFTSTLVASKPPVPPRPPKLTLQTSLPNLSTIPTSPFSNLSAGVPSWHSLSHVALLHRQGSLPPSLVAEVVDPPSLPSIHSLSDAKLEDDRLFFRLFLPQTSADQDESVLCCRKKHKREKWRFSFDINKMRKRNNKSYVGKLTRRAYTENKSSAHYQLTLSNGVCVATISIENIGRKQNCYVQLMNEYFNCVEKGKKGRCFHGVYHRYSQPMLQLRVDAGEERQVMLVEQIGDEWKNGLQQRDANSSHELTAMSNKQFLSIQRSASVETMSYLRSSSPTEFSSSSSSATNVHPRASFQRSTALPSNLPAIPPRPPKSFSILSEGSKDSPNRFPTPQNMAGPISSFPPTNSTNTSTVAQKPPVALVRPSSISLQRYAITFDYPLTVFLSFAIFCALESSRVSSHN